MGKVLLSGLSEKTLGEVLAIGPLAKLTPNTITDITALLRELERVKRQGFAVDREESFLGIRCVAAPICGTDGKMVAAMSATVPKQRMGDQRMREIRMQVVETARLISEWIAVNQIGD
jgi:IclR family acetate operon transcriptional repressor